MDLNKPALKLVIIKMVRLEVKETIPKAARENQVVTCKEAPTGLSSDSSTETFQGRREWPEIFTGMKSKDLQPKLLYQERLSFKIGGGIRSFPTRKS